MLECLVLVGSLFLSDGQIMVAMDGVTGVERQGNLLVVTAQGAPVHLDASAYPIDIGVHDIIGNCAASAADPISDVEYVSNIDPVAALPEIRTARK